MLLQVHFPATHEATATELRALQVARVAAHLGLHRSEAEVRRVAERCGFGQMRAEFASRDAAAESSGGFTKKNHLRAGEVGGWRSVLSEADEAAFDQLDAALVSACDGLALGGRDERS